MYTGTYYIGLDGTDRFEVPEPIYDIIKAYGHIQWYMTRGSPRCIFMFHLDTWKTIAEGLNKHSPISSKALEVRRHLYGSAERINIDSPANVTIQRPLLDYAGIVASMVLVGVDDHLEFWNEPAWHAHSGAVAETFKNTASDLFDLKN